jgi:putative hydrolase of the HAD superfamily
MSDHGHPAASAIGAVVFDFDGLILDTETSAYLTMRAAFADHGVELSLESFSTLLGRADNRPWVEWLEEEVGSPIEREAVHARRVEAHHALVAEQQVLPGVVDVIDQADALGIPALVASSSPRYWIDQHLDRLGLLDRFAGLFTREDVERAKPWPDLYLAAVASVGVAPERAIAFEDSYNGSAAAVAAGLFCVAVPSDITAHQDFTHCDLVVGSLVDVVLSDLAPQVAGVGHDRRQDDDASRHASSSDVAIPTEE